MTRTFRLAARGSAAAIFEEDQAIEIPYRAEGAITKLTFRTRYLERGHAIRVPGDLWLDAVGPAADLAAAASRFTNAGRDLASFIALSSNASIAPLEPEIIFETTPSTESREHFQRYVPPDDFAFTSRFVDVDSTLTLIGCVAASPERNRLVRATSHYCEALRDWRIGQELLALSHLFMGVEAVKTASLRHLLSKRGVARESLAVEWGYKEGGRLTLDTFLDQQARLRLVFRGDSATHKLAKATSDAFEHGLKNAGALYEPAGRCLIPTAQYLREAILEASALQGEALEVLLGDRFRHPRGPAGVDTYIKSMLVGVSDDQAAVGLPYPHYRWKAGIKNVSWDPDAGRYSFQPNHVLTPALAEGASFENVTYEGWDRSVFSRAEK